jgi:hypothetical protein
MVIHLAEIQKMGYENFLYSPILSLIIGILLFFGLISFGSFFLSFFFNKNISNNNLFLLHSPLIGSNVLLFFFYPLASLGLLNSNILKITSYLLLILSIHFIISICRISFTNLSKYKILILILILYFLLSLAPFTHADTLEYSLVSATNLINTGSFSKTLLPMNTKAEGAGEILIALSLISGTEQFANLIQFGGFLSIIASFLHIQKKYNYFLLLSVISTPCFIFFLSSPKPQLMLIGNILFIFSYLFKKKLDLLKQNELFFIFTVMLSINFLSKFSFILSSIFLFIYIFIKLVSKDNYKYALISLSLVIIIMLVPDYYFNYKNFSSSILDYVQSPMPVNIDAYKQISIAIKNISEGSRIVPLWVVVPKSLGMISTIIGPVFLSFLLFKLKKFNIYFLFIFLFFVLILIFGQATSRFLFEGFVILQFLLAYCEFRNKNYSIIFINYIKLQSLLCIGILTVLIFNLTPGAFSYKARDEVMKNNANGYSLIKWVNKNINKNDLIISTNRSVSLFNVPAYYLVELQYIDFSNPSSEIFTNFIREKKVNKILIQSNVNPGKFYNCRGKLLATKKNVGSEKGRNPFNQSKPYDASIYEFDYSNFPKCLF